MKILVTGSAGFLGSIITQHALSLGHQVEGLNRSVGEYRIDLSKAIPNVKQADIIVHCAGKAHSVPKTPSQEQEFYGVNVQGTKNLLDGLVNPPKALVFISTIAVYGCEMGTNISENQELCGSTPYAKSKIQAEQIVLDWGLKKSIPILILRLPLIVGPNPPGNLSKMIDGISKGRYLSINRGKAKKSMVMAEDVAAFICGNFEKSGIYNLTDGHHPSFREIEMVICKQLGKTLPLNLPNWLASLLGTIGDVYPKIPISSAAIKKMTADLTFDDKLARENAGWNPSLVVEKFKIK